MVLLGVSASLILSYMVYQVYLYFDRKEKAVEEAKNEIEQNNMEV